MAWEKRITHAGLNTYRLIRGQSQDDVNLKARLQSAQWEERWQAKTRAQKSRANHMTGKELALERTLELEGQRDALQTLLSDAIKARAPFDWEALKPRSPFGVKPPTQPSLKSSPLPPVPLVQRDPIPTPERKVVESVAPEWNLSERFVPILRKKKQAAAEEQTRQLLAAEEAAYQTLVAAKGAADTERERQEQSSETRREHTRKHPQRLLRQMKHSKRRTSRRLESGRPPKQFFSESSRRSVLRSTSLSMHTLLAILQRSSPTSMKSSRELPTQTPSPESICWISSQKRC